MKAIRDLLPLNLRKTAKVARARALEAAGSERYSAPALYGMDRRILALCGKGGTFLEVGANDGFSQSNTYLLERFYGWSGILIEPDPALAKRCGRLRRRSRVVNVACVSDSTSVPFLDLARQDLMSVSLGSQAGEDEAPRIKGVPQRVRVKTRTLSEVIDELSIASIDLISIDVEGAELDLMKGVDWDRHTPGYLLVETARLPEVAQLLAGYMRCVDQWSHHDYLFVRDEE